MRQLEAPAGRSGTRKRCRASLRGVTISVAHDPGAEAQVDFGGGEARVRRGAGAGRPPG